MSNHFGTVGERITREVVLINDFSYISKYGYLEQENYIYTMKDADGNIFVWKTTKLLVIEIPDKRNELDCIRKGDKMKITGTVKEHGDYKGENQTVLTRCKYSLIAHKPDEKTIKREQQLLSLRDGDFIQKMPYKQYKEHYADCETVAGSYVKDDYLPATIEVIIRAGRLKKSGVRGEHFSGYTFITDTGGKVSYRAVSEKNARKQLKKDFPNSEGWELFAVYKHNNIA
jgi:hypothetical protein